MRRLSKTLPGKLLCQVLSAVIILPYLSLGLAARAAAEPARGAATQLTSNRLWAVMPFVDRNGDKRLGVEAADRFSEELTKRQGEFRPPVEVASPENVKRILDTLGLNSPVTDETSFLRVGQELRAECLIRGEVLNTRIQGVPGGKQAEVIMRVEVVNVASGLPINGAALSTASTVRTGMTDEAMLNEAFTEAASRAVGRVLSQTLPSATVLNTFVQTALLNQGARSGFTDGQSVIIQRGREQVATGRIKDVEPEFSSVQIVNVTKGVQPGDKVTVVFAVPDILPFFGSTVGSVQVKRSARMGNSSGLVSLLLLVALGVFLLGKGNATSQSPIGTVIAEPTLFPEADSQVQNSSGEAAVRISWVTDLFAGGAATRLAFQIYRSDFPQSAVQVAFSGTVAYDTIIARDASFTWYNFNHIYASVGVEQSGVLGCTSITPTAPAPIPTPPGITPGRSYSYSVSEVFQMSSINLPISVTSSTGTTSGGTGTTSTGTGTTSSGTTSTGTGTGTGTSGLTSSGTTGGTTGTTTGTTATTTGTTSTGTTSSGTTSGTTTGATECDFETVPQTAIGLATPLNTVSVTSPTDQTTITAPTPFTFTSAVNASFPSQFQYTLQFSTTPAFTKGSNTYTYAPFITGSTGALSTPAIDTNSSVLPAAILAATLVYWRVGARSTLDNPGPVIDISGQRFIWSVPRQFKRLITPPPGPTVRKKTKK